MELISNLTHAAALLSLRCAGYVESVSFHMQHPRVTYTNLAKELYDDSPLCEKSSSASKATRLESLSGG